MDLFIILSKLNLIETLLLQFFFVLKCFFLIIIKKNTLVLCFLSRDIDALIATCLNLSALAASLKNDFTCRCSRIILIILNVSVAIKGSHVDIVKVLIDAGCDVNKAEIESMETPVYAAVRLGKN